MYSLTAGPPLRKHVSKIIAFTFTRYTKYPVENLHLHISTNANSRVPFLHR